MAGSLNEWQMTMNWYCRNNKLPLFPTAGWYKLYIVCDTASLQSLLQESIHEFLKKSSYIVLLSPMLNLYCKENSTINRLGNSNVLRHTHDVHHDHVVRRT